MHFILVRPYDDKDIVELLTGTSPWPRPNRKDPRHGAGPLFLKSCKGFLGVLDGMKLDTITVEY